MVWSHGPPHAKNPGTPGAGGIENLFVQMRPPSSECHRAAFPPDVPEKAVMTISAGFTRLTAMLVSPSLNVSVRRRFGFVLLTTALTINTSLMVGGMAPDSAPSRPRCQPSSGTSGRVYGCVSGGKLGIDARSSGSAARAPGAHMSTLRRNTAMYVQGRCVVFSFL